MKRLFIILSFVFVLVFCTTVSANSKTLICTHETTGDIAHVHGVIVGATKSEEATLLVKDSAGDIKYLDRALTTTSGTFDFYFVPPKSEEAHSYDYIVGTSAGTATFNGVLTIDTKNDKDDEVTETDIVCDDEVDGNRVRIFGQIPGATETTEVSIIVCDDPNRNLDTDFIYVNQILCGVDGNFEFTFKLPLGINTDDCLYTIGNNAGLPSYHGTLYDGPVYEVSDNQFVYANLYVDIENYTPCIKGIINCMEGTTTTINIVNTTNQTVIANDTFTGSDNPILYNLPNLLSPKEYTITITCNKDGEVMSAMNVTIDSSIILVSIDGTASVADNVSLNVSAVCPSIEAINKSATITENTSLSVTIPNLVANTQVELTLEGFETTTERLPLPNEYSITGTRNETVKFVATAENISSFEDKIYTIKYDETQITPVSFYGAYYKDSLQIGTKGNVNILSHVPGQIQFKMSNINIPQDKIWSGLLNVFKFRFNPSYDGTTYIQFY